jgi:TM2 domain-containing membrane protein YozV
VANGSNACFFLRLYLFGSFVFVFLLSSGAVILTKETGIDTPYMDKFAVSKLMQGTGTGKALVRRPK